MIVDDALPAAAMHTATALIMWTFGGVLSLAVPHDGANWRHGTARALLRGTLRALAAAGAGAGTVTLAEHCAGGAADDADEGGDAAPALGAKLSWVC